MTRGALAYLIAFALIAGGVLPASGQAAQPPRATLQGLVCQRSANPLNRAVSVTAVMRPLPRTRRMELRFALERRPAGRTWAAPVHGRYLGVWLHPANRTLGQWPSDVWVLNKPVVNLAAPATYWFRVTFRWVAASGVIATQTRVTPGCAQPKTPASPAGRQRAAKLNR